MNIICTLAENILNNVPVSFPAEWPFSFVSLKSDAMRSALKNADCLFVSAVHPISKEMLQNAPRLRLIHTLGVGFNKIDLDYTRERGIYVCTNQGANGRAVAEHAVSLMLNGLRRMTHYERLARNGAFKSAVRETGAEGFHELGSRTVGLIGLGDNGRATAKLLNAFGCKLYYFKRHRADEETERSLQVKYLPLHELLRACNVVSLHLPSNAESIGLIGEKEFALMQKDTLLVNVARGEIVDTDALVHALESGRIYGAALDVTYPEPPENDHPLLNLSEEAAKRLTLTPHMAGMSQEFMTTAIKNVIQNIRTVERGERPERIVNGL